MRPTTLRSLQRLLDAPGDPRLGSLTRESARLLALQGVLRECLGSPLADHLYLVRADPGAIVIETDGSTWASRLRYQSGVIAAELARHAGLASRQVLVKIGSGYWTPPIQKFRQRTVPTVVAEQLRRAADHVSDPALAAALRRLARHTPARKS